MNNKGYLKLNNFKIEVGRIDIRRDKDYKLTVLFHYLDSASYTPDEAWNSFRQEAGPVVKTYFPAAKLVNPIHPLLRLEYPKPSLIPDPKVWIEENRERLQNLDEALEQLRQECASKAQLQLQREEEDRKARGICDYLHSVARKKAFEKTGYEEKLKLLRAEVDEECRRELETTLLSEELQKAYEAARTSARVRELVRLNVVRLYLPLGEKSDWFGCRDFIGLLQPEQTEEQNEV